MSGNRSKSNTPLDYHCTHSKLITLGLFPHKNWLLATHDRPAPSQEVSSREDVSKLWTSEIFLAKFSVIHASQSVMPSGVMKKLNFMDSKRPTETGISLYRLKQSIAVTVTQYDVHGSRFSMVTLDSVVLKVRTGLVCTVGVNIISTVKHNYVNRQWCIDWAEWEKRSLFATFAPTLLNMIHVPTPLII